MELLEKIARYSLFLPIFLFFLRRGTQKKENWVIFLFTLFSLIQQVALHFSTLHYPKIAQFISFSNPITYLLFIFFFFRLVIINKFNQQIVLFFTLLYVAVQIIPIIFNTSASITSIITTFNTVIILLFCLLYFFEQIRFPKTIFIYTQSSFWVIAGFLIFSSGTFFIFWYNNINYQTAEFDDLYMAIHALIYITRNILFSVAFLIRSEKQPFTDSNLSLT